MCVQELCVHGDLSKEEEFCTELSSPSKSGRTGKCYFSCGQTGREAADTSQEIVSSCLSVVRGDKSLRRSELTSKQTDWTYLKKTSST